jgi:hypothetical protein
MAPAGEHRGTPVTAVDEPTTSPWETVAASVLEERDWEHVTARVRALGWDFDVRTNVPALGRHLDRVFSSMVDAGDAAHHYSLVRTDRGTWQRHRLYRDGRRILDAPDPARTFLHLLWDVNQQTFGHTTDKLIVHAAMLEDDGRALLLSAPSESGKTTLAAGLVERGFGYGSDEATAVDPETLLVHPYAKSLSVDVGSQAFLSHLEPSFDGDIGDYLTGQWQVTPDSIRPGAALRGPIEPAWIITPQYVKGATTELLPLSRAETLALLMEQGLNLHVAGAEGFERLGELVRRCRCARLVMGDLPTACDAVIRMVRSRPTHD